MAALDDDLADGATLLDRLLRHGGRGLVADVAVERGDDRRRALGQLPGALDVGLDAVDAAVGEQPADVAASSVVDSRMLRAITGSMTLSSKAPDAPATVMAVSLPITWAQAIRVASGRTGLTLPGMMLDPGWRSGRWISPSPDARAGRHPAQVVADLGQADGDRP